MATTFVAEPVQLTTYNQLPVPSGYLTGDANVTLKFQTVSNKTCSVLYKNALTEANRTKLTDLSAAATNELKTVTDSLGGKPRALLSSGDTRIAVGYARKLQLSFCMMG